MLACILAYPVLVHLSIIFQQPVLAVLALVALYGSFAFRPLRAMRPAAWLGLFAALALSAWIVRQGVALYALYLPPIVLPAAMLGWWAPTLRRGNVPFVTRIATHIRGELPPDYAAYTRAVTVLWVGVFGLLLLVGAGTALWASPPVWSFATNIANPLFLGCVFLGEYLFRRIRFRHHEHPGFVTFIRQVAKAGVRPGA